jgi:glucose-6-phosphate 1-epimerase
MSDPIDIFLYIPGKLDLGQGPGGLGTVEITTPYSSASITLLGAHVTHFALNGEEPLIFMSSGQYLANKPIRGGVPVIFPWFGPRQGYPDAPSHGFARTQNWELEATKELEDGSVQATFKLQPTKTSVDLWPEGGEWVPRHRITVGKTLTMELEVENRGTAPIQFEDALHSYFKVSDVREIEVLGLENTEYLDKTDALERKTQPNEPIRFSSETDRTYVNTRADCQIIDLGLNRRILIQKTNSLSAIVWNPWIEKAKALADLGDDDWINFVCVETGNVADNTITLDPSERRSTVTTVQSLALG